MCIVHVPKVLIQFYRPLKKNYSSHDPVPLRSVPPPELLQERQKGTFLLVVWLVEVQFPSVMRTLHKHTVH
jgi:hypothetical protein